MGTLILQRDLRLLLSMFSGEISDVFLYTVFPTFNLHGELEYPYRLFSTNFYFIDVITPNNSTSFGRVIGCKDFYSQ